MCLRELGGEARDSDILAQEIEILDSVESLGFGSELRPRQLFYTLRRRDGGHTAFKMKTFGASFPTCRFSRSADSTGDLFSPS